MSVGRCYNLVSFNSSISNLHNHRQTVSSRILTSRGSHLSDNVGVSEAHDNSILWRVVLILVLYHKTLTGIVVCFSFSSALELDLITLEVGSVLHYLDKRLRTKGKISARVKSHT